MPTTQARGIYPPAYWSNSPTGNLSPGNAMNRHLHDWLPLLLIALVCFVVVAMDVKL